MAPKKVDQGAIIILDVGRNVSAPKEKGEKSFFEEARECATRLIERKIVSQDNNLLGIMLLGSKKTKNGMAEQVEGAFRHIEMFSELPTQSKGDWVDAIIAAADHFKSQGGVQIVNKKIILMTNFTQFVEVTDGATETFEHTMRYLLFHKKKGVSSRPWNVDLSIGPNIKIPVSTYIRLKDDSVVKRWQKAVKCPLTNTASTNEAVKTNDVFINAENQTAYQEEPELIKGYQYGQRMIPVTELDQSVLYESGEKCLSVYGFTHASNVTWHSLTGDGLHYLFGRKGDKKAQQAVRCLVECLHEMNLVGIARRVYNKNNAPKMFALVPVIDTNNYICLSMASLCFKEDIKYMSFPATSSKKLNCTDAQVQGFVDLIKAMDLTRAYDDTFEDAEALPIGETVSPFAQHMLDCIAFRAMNPGKPLPQPRDDIMDLFKMPPLIEKRSREPMEKLKSLFDLVKVEKKERKKKVRILSEPSNVIPAPQGNEVPDDIGMIKIELPVKPQNEIKRIGTLDPIGDYIALKANDRPLANLAQEITAALESMINGNLDGDYTRAFDAVLFFRKECVDSDPSYYNNWLKTFKNLLTYRYKHDIVGMISEKNANFILKAENNLSKYDTADSHQDSQLYENDTLPNSIQLTLKTEDDLFADF
ncbi:Ku P80 DNA helicase [Operophtera brumata]|uniref:Ku P80 DNA helicase n=1 Tax=Operophtera brumata TaxID=104452 RepID=A0A0L7LAA1_OPEBR|nr:Ku P80 DNA helicase [Operophtera brumata]